MSFVHLHNHSDFSALDGAATVSGYATRAAELGMSAMALTDHGVLSGAYAFTKACREAGIKPILGLESYAMPIDYSRTHREPIRIASGGDDDISGGGAFTHMTLWAENNAGWVNLQRMMAEANITGMYRKPRIDRELFEAHGAGVLATTGCPSGEIATLLRLGRYDEAIRVAATYRDIFGQGNYYAEVMNHGIDIEKRAFEDLLRLAKDLNLPLIATNDCHYVNPGDADTHEAYLCVQSGSKLDDPNRFRFEARDFYLKSADEMRELWKDLPEACDNTVLVAERCNVDLAPRDGLMPVFPVPAGINSIQLFSDEVRDGLARRLDCTPPQVPAEYRERAVYEFNIIKDMGFTDYFLVTSDLMRWAKNNGIACGPGRGCLVGSSEILTPNGVKALKDIHVGDLVYDQDGRVVTVPRVFKYECDEELIEIKALGGPAVTMTRDHEVLVSRNPTGSPDWAHLEWLPAEKVQVGDFVVMPQKRFNEARQTWSRQIGGSARRVLNGMAYMRVVSVADAPAEEYVYDFEVPTTHSYLTTSFVVHNSAGGSLVAYALDITEVDPLKHGLFFERFLNPERVSMPDIDMDFDDRRRGEVIDYVKQKYGEDKVANITTYSVIKAKAALKDAARVLGVDYAAAEALTRAYPPDIMGKSMPLADVFDPDSKRYAEAQGFREHLGKNPELQPVVDLGLKFEGLKRGYGQHAAGVIMSSQALTNTVPLMRVKADGPLVTGYEYPSCEDLGLLKMDFLGLSNLGTIDEALRNINVNRETALTMDEILSDLTDSGVYRLLSRGETLGVFQLDSPPMRALLQRMQPDCFDDIPAVLALYRPGPMGANAHNDYADRKNGRQPVRHIHPELAEALEEVLGETWGLIVFQESVMRIAQVLAGYSLAQADNLRRAMGKKKKEILDKEYIGFAEGMRNNGYSDDAIKTLWDVLVPFADYAFARPHAVAYGMVSYITAYLKAHHPAEYMAALLTTNSNDKDKTAIYLAEARRMGLELLSPSVNESGAAYTPVGKGIRVGLGAIRNVGVDKVQAIIDERTANGPYTDYGNFLSRLYGSAAFNSRVIDSLIRAGALDEFGVPRSALCEATIYSKNVTVGAKYSVDRAVKAAQREAEGKKPTATKAEHQEGNKFLGTVRVPHPCAAELIEVELEVTLPSLPEWPSSHLAVIEKEMLGLYVAHHPLDGKKDKLRSKARTSIGDLLATHIGGDHEEADEVVDAIQVNMAGMVTHAQAKRTRKGTTMGTFTLMDVDGEIDCVVFPHVWQRLSAACKENMLVQVRGRLDLDGRVQVIVNGIAAIN